MHKRCVLEGPDIIFQGRDPVYLLFLLADEAAVPGFTYIHFVVFKNVIPVIGMRLQLGKRIVLGRIHVPVFIQIADAQKAGRDEVMHDKQFSVRTELDIIFNRVNTFLIGALCGFQCVLRIHRRIAAVSEDQRRPQKNRRVIMEELLRIQRCFIIIRNDSVDTVCAYRDQRAQVAVCLYPHGRRKRLQLLHSLFIRCFL